MRHRFLLRKDNSNLLLNNITLNCITCTYKDVVQRATVAYLVATCSVCMRPLVFPFVGGYIELSPSRFTLLELYITRRKAKPSLTPHLFLRCCLCSTTEQDVTGERKCGSGLSGIYCKSCSTIKQYRSLLMRGYLLVRYAGLSKSRFSTMIAVTKLYTVASI